MHGDGSGGKFAIAVVKATEADLAEMGSLGRVKFRIINDPVTRVGLAGVTVDNFRWCHLDKWIVGHVLRIIGGHKSCIGEDNQMLAVVKMTENVGITQSHGGLVHSCIFHTLVLHGTGVDPLLP